MQVQSLNREDPLEEDMATHSSILAWRVPWTEKPGRLQSTGLQTDTTEATQLTLTHGQCQMVELCLKNKLRLYFKYHTQQAVSFFLSAYFLSSPTPSLLPFFFFFFVIFDQEGKKNERERKGRKSREREKKRRKEGGEEEKRERKKPKFQLQGLAPACGSPSQACHGSSMFHACFQLVIVAWCQ